MGPLSSMKWLNHFLTDTPGDSQVGGPSRQVPGACWSRVLPTPPPNAKLQLWSYEMAVVLGLNKGEAEIFR